MKRKFVSVLLTLMLVLSFSLVAAVPVGADANKTVTPPNIDGTIAPGEWDTAHIEFDTGPRPCGTANPGGWNLSGAKGRFLWDETNLYGLVEAYPNTCGTGANPNGPFDAINFEVYVNGDDWCPGASYFLTAWPDGTTYESPGAVVMGSPDAMLIEFKIPIANIRYCIENRTFDPTSDWLEYRLRTTDIDAAGGFDSRDQTLGWVVEPTMSPTGSGFQKLDFTLPTKADILKDSSVPGKGLEKAPGLQKPFNPDSKAGENAGKK